LHSETSQTRGRGIDRPSEHHDDCGMDLSELSSPNASMPPTARPASMGSHAGEDPWRLATQLGMEAACALTPALQAVHQLQATGRIDRAGLHALVADIEQARHVAMLGQQIARLALGGIQQQPEPLNLTQALREVLAMRQGELNARGLAVKQLLHPAEVVVDATLLSAVFDALLEWSLRHTRTTIEIKLDTRAWPAHPRLVCRYGHVPEDQVPTAQQAAQDTVGMRPHHVAALYCLRWSLLAQLARTMQLHIERVDTAGDTTLTLEFPHAAPHALQDATAPIELSSTFTASTQSPALNGIPVLVLALRRDVANQIRQAVSHMGLALSFVGSVAAAREFCQQGMPQAIIYESVVYDGAFDTLRSDIRHQQPELAWIEIAEQGESFEISSFDGTSMARIGRDAINSSLASALLFELAKAA
jgi:hypothetical protein